MKTRRKPLQTSFKEKAPSLPYKILHCPLFLHQKHSHACIALRAKGVCKVNCKDFFEWAMKNEETIKEILNKHESAIRSYRKSKEIDSQASLLEAVMPKGGKICDFCGKAFKTEGRLKGHRERKHKRQLFQKAQKIPCRDQRGVG